MPAFIWCQVTRRQVTGRLIISWGAFTITPGEEWQPSRLEAAQKVLTRLWLYS